MAAHLSHGCDNPGGPEVGVTLLVSRAAEAFPNVCASLEGFERFLRDRIREAGGMAHPEHLALSDLYLAFACAEGNREALTELERSYWGELASAVSRVDPSKDFVDEVLQRLRLELLLPKGNRPPRIGTYAGRGPLRKWLRMTAVRCALALKPKTSSGSDELAMLEFAGGDVEERLVRHELRARVKKAVQQAVQELSTREQRILRLRALEELNLEDVAKIYEVHLATVCRWEQKAKQKLLSKTRKLLIADLDVPAPEVAQWIDLVRSQLEISFNRLLAQTDSVPTLPD